MRELSIKLTGYSKGTVIEIDGKTEKFKKNEFGSLIFKYRTEKDKVNIKIFRMLDFGGIFWFITQLFFFVISIFGLFDRHRRENCIIIDFEAEVDLKEENELTLRINSAKGNNRAIDIQTSLPVKEICNEYILDTKAKKTFKILKIAKIFLASAIVVTATIVLMIKI